MLHGLLKAAQEGGIDQVSVVDGARFLAHSALLGSAMMATTIWTNRRIGSKPPAPGKEATTFADLILNSSNVLFLCFGMTGVMLLVNNNLARAFAIGAAIALVRFRIKVDSKTLSMALFYGVLTGMACGVNQVMLAYPIAFFFGVFQVIVVGVARYAENKYPSTIISPALALSKMPTATPSTPLSETKSATAPAGIGTPAGLSY